MFSGYGEDFVLDLLHLEFPGLETLDPSLSLWCRMFFLAGNLPFRHLWGHILFVGIGPLGHLASWVWGMALALGVFCFCEVFSRLLS